MKNGRGSPQVEMVGVHRPVFQFVLTISTEGIPGRFIDRMPEAEIHPAPIMGPGNTADNASILDDFNHFHIIPVMIDPDTALDPD